MVFLFQTQLKGSPSPKHVTHDDLQTYLLKAENTAQILHDASKSKASVNIKVRNMDFGSTILVETGASIGAHKANVLTPKYGKYYPSDRTPFEYETKPTAMSDIGLYAMVMHLPTGLYGLLESDASPWIGKPNPNPSSKGTAFTGASAESVDYVRKNTNIGVGKLFNLSNDLLLNAFAHGTIMHSRALVSQNWMLDGNKFDAVGCFLKLRLERTGKKFSPYAVVSVALLPQKEYAGGVDEKGRPGTLPIVDMKTDRINQMELPMKNAFNSDAQVGFVWNSRDVIVRLERLNADLKLPRMQVGTSLGIDQNRKITAYAFASYNITR